ncbi:hypothetical protein D3C76_1383430 [compost metagenome]
MHVIANNHIVTNHRFLIDKAVIAYPGVNTTADVVTKKCSAPTTARTQLTACTDGNKLCAFFEQKLHLPLTT